MVNKIAFLTITSIKWKFVVGRSRNNIQYISYIVQAKPESMKWEQEKKNYCCYPWSKIWIVISIEEINGCRMNTDYGTMPFRKSNFTCMC